MSGIRRAILFSSSERYVVVTLNLLQTLVVSRILDIHEIGLVALGLAATQLLDAVRDSGTFNYLIQRKRLTQEMGRTVFTIFLISSVVLCLLLCFSATPIAAYYEQPALRHFLVVMALGSLVTPFASPLLAMMRRDLEFGSLAAVNCTAAVVQTVLLIFLAWAGWGAVSYAWAMMGWNLACVLACLMVRPDLRWMYRPCLRDWRRSLSFGGISSATALLNRVYELLPVFVLSRLFPLEAVGLYNRAMLVAQLPDRLLFTNISNVVLPALSRTVRTGGSLSDAYLSGLTLISVIQWPALVLVAALADPLVAVLLGPQWSGCVPIVQIAALASLLYFPAILSYPMLVASGGLRDTLTSSLIHLPLGAAVVLASAQWGPVGIAAGQFVAMPLLILVDLVFIRRRAPFSGRQFAGALRLSALVTLCSAVFPVAVTLWVGVGEPVPPSLAIATASGAAAGWFLGAAAVGHPIYGHIVGVAHGVLSRSRFAASRTPAE